VAVDAVGLLRFPDPPADTSFSALFPMYEARPVQAALDVGGLVEHQATFAVLTR
jgi:hypothetical protein